MRWPECWAESMKRVVWPLLLLLLVGACGTAREVTVSLWISGGAEGLLDGGRVAPGWLGLLSKLGDRPQEEPWVEVGGSRHLETLADIGGVRMPEAVIPGESLLRVKGVQLLEASGIPWVISNAGILPQFPDAVLPVDRAWTWRHPDGGRIRVQGLMSDTAPLRVPADRLRPLQILPSTETARTSYLNQHAPGVLEVLVLPEDADGAEGSRRFPDADIVVEFPTGAAAVVEVGKGKRLRVRPGRFGRSVIRAWAKWDTVTKTFSTPKAEVVWIPECDYTRIEVPAELAEILRSLEPRVPLAEVDVIWEPGLKRVEVPTLRPDSIRAQRVPEDDAWLLVEVPAAQWAEWAKVDGAGWTWIREAKPRTPRVLLPATVAAGRGDWDCPIRQDLLKGRVRGEWLEATTRDFLKPEPSN